MSRLVFRFKDGSVDDDTTVFSQSGNFRLITDHHIQKGPIFPQLSHVFVNASTGQVAVRYKDKDHEKIETDHWTFRLMSQMAFLLKNIRADTTEAKLSFVGANAKPRLVHLSITPQGDESFSLAGVGYKATRFRVKMEIGGISGMIAPL